MKTSLSDCLAENKGVLPGFDTLRVCLALLILWFHCFPICYGPGFLWKIDFIRPFARALLPIFFCLSGFLVMGSALRLKSLKIFLGFRLLRIFPALMVEVTLSAIIMGGVITALPWKIYYTHPEFWSYFGNIIGRVKFTLPEVFSENPVQIVNINMWTLVPEFYCYALMALLMAASIIYKRHLVLILCALLTLILLCAPPSALLWIGQGDEGHNVSLIALVYSFLVGAVIFLFSDYVPVRAPFFWAALLLTVVFFSFKETTIFGILTVSYCTVYLGLIRFPRIPLLLNGDYSYGIYLYGYPISQMLWYFLPVLRSPWILCVATTFATLIFAAISWHYIEKPSLAAKKHLRRPSI